MRFLSNILVPLIHREDGGLAHRLERKAPLAKLIKDLLSNKAEVTGTVKSETILTRYEAMNMTQKKEFFLLLARDFDLPYDEMMQALSNYHEENHQKNYKAIMRLMESPRQNLFKRLNQVSGATARLVGMRKDILAIMRGEEEQTIKNELARVEGDLKHLFISWFNRGFLVMEPINWSSPALLLEKIIAYEAVHEIQHWQDLRSRLQPDDRRCFAFFHPSLPEEPLIFVEVALTNHIPNSIEDILQEDRQPIPLNEVNTAVFYSISNCQKGLAGISFGNSLIKTVVEHLRRDYLDIKTFITLSPVPGLMRWAKSQAISEEDIKESTKLSQLAAHYLLHAKDTDGFPIDPVARFHLNNGARLEAIHTNANPSKRGMAESNGVMVNYFYKLSKIADNHEAFINRKELIATRKVTEAAKAFSR